MKQSLRFMATLLLTMVTALTSWAADWTVNITPVALTPGDTVYVKNVGTGRYIGGGEAWGTQAIVAPLSSAAKCIILKLDDGTYQIKNNAAGWTKSDNDNIIYRTPNDGTVGSGVKGCFCDYSTGWNLVASKWSVENVGNNVYTFQIPNTADYQLTEESTSADSLKGYIAGEYLGVNIAHKSGAATDGVTYGLYYDIVYADMAENCQFEFVPCNIAEAKAKLLKAVESASAAGIDVTAGANLLANADATVADVTAEATRLSDAVENAASPTNPQDITSKYITNPTPIAEGTPVDWTVCYRDGSSASTGSTSDGVGEIWNDGGVILKYTINQLPAGVYRFTAIALTRTDMKGLFFVNSDTINIATVSSSTVNSRSGASTWFTQDDDNDGVLNGTNVISLVLSEPTDVTIGLMSDTTEVGDAWTVWREFKLESLGTSLESFQYVNNDILEQIAEIKNTSDVKYTASLMTEAETAATEGKNATDKATSASKYAEAKAKYDELKLNVTAWQKLYDVATSAEEESWQLANGEAVQAVCEEANEMMSDLTASTDEVNAMIAKIKQTLDDARKSSYSAGDDVTNLITNPTFNDETVAASKTQPQSKEGWTGATFGTGGNADSRLCEEWANDFDTYQDITNLQAGAYRLSIQAWMRPGTAEETWTAYKAGNKEVPAWIYIGKTEQRIHNICDWTWSEAQDDQESWSTLEDGVVIPNTMATSYTVMSADADVYNNSVVGLVTEKGGTMRIGIKSKDPDQNSSRWLVFHDFTMTYLGTDVEYVKPVLDAKIAEFKGITDPMGANEKALLTAALTTAETASAGSDGDAMLSAYAGLSAVTDTVNASIDAYKALQSSLDSLQSMSQTGASDDAIAKANALITEVTAAIADGSIAILDVPAKQAEMSNARKNLMVKEGSDAAPADYTAWIVNPTFEDEFTGWTVEKTKGNDPTATGNVAEIWNSQANVYQDITGLPEGTYQVKLKGFFRQVGVKRAWEQLLGDSIEDVSRAQIYANADIITPNMWATREYKDVYSATGSGWAETIDSTTTDSVHYFLPNNPASARVAFDANCYQLSHYSYVNETGALRLGFMVDAYKSADWLMTTDWELYYLGKNSVHATETGISTLATDEVVRFSEIYTADGRRANSLQKGLNIVRGQKADGTLVTKKIVVK